MIKYNIGWGLTNLCNMNCKFCYSKETRKSIENITIDDWKNFVDENFNNIETINYGTGENALSDDFFEFVDYVRTNYPDIRQSVTTNGYLGHRVLNNKRLYDIYYKAIDEVDVSLDFGDRQKHNLFRGQPNAYDWAIETLEMLNKDKKLATIVFVGFEDTMQPSNLDSLFSIAKKYNAYLRLNIYRPVSESKQINEKFVLPYKTLINGLEYINDKYKIVSLNDVLFGNIYTPNCNIKENTGIDSIRILPDGNICPSTYLISEEYRSVYNIKDHNVLSKISFNSFKEATIPKECEDCILKEKCRGGVYDRRMLWNNKLEKRDPYCPKNNNDDINKIKFKSIKKTRVSVHDGYLPTMFFRP